VHVGNEIVISTLVVGNPPSFIAYLNWMHHRMLTQCSNVRMCKTSWYHSDPGLTGTLEMIQEILQSSSICLSIEAPEETPSGVLPRDVE